MNPSKGAIRAAEIITQGQFGDPKRYDTEYGTKTVQGIAAIIDRHTVTPDLVEALEKINWVIDSGADWEEIAMECDTIARNAIAKVTSNQTQRTIPQ